MIVAMVMEMEKVVVAVIMMVAGKVAEGFYIAGAIVMAMATMMVMVMVLMVVMMSECNDKRGHGSGGGDCDGYCRGDGDGDGWGRGDIHGNGVGYGIDYDSKELIEGNIHDAI
jgi:hypothetical protein